MKRRFASRIFGIYGENYGPKARSFEQKPASFGHFWFSFYKNRRVLEQN
jgi:hypothetical protein